MPVCAVVLGAMWLAVGRPGKSHPRDGVEALRNLWIADTTAFRCLLEGLGPALPPLNSGLEPSNPCRGGGRPT